MMLKSRTALFLEEPIPSKYRYIDGFLRELDEKGDFDNSVSEGADIQTSNIEFNGKTIKSTISPSITNFLMWFKKISQDDPVVIFPKLVYFTFHDVDYNDMLGDVWNTICSFSICFGGTHCAVLQIYDCEMKTWISEMRSSPLRRILEDPSMFIAGIEMNKFKEKVATEWGVHVANPVNLLQLAEKSLGAEVPYNMMNLYDAVIGDVEIERRPMELQNRKWFFADSWSPEMQKFEAIEGYLGFEIARRCLINTGVDI